MSSKISAIIQARMTSTRLPGKVLMEIEGKSMLWHVINRLGFSKKIDDIILAIPDTAANNKLEEFARKHNIKYFRGSEEDVLSRYYQAAKMFNLDMIVRITSDCPLIDPKLVDEAVEEHLKSGADYTSNVQSRMFPRGLDVEVFNFKILERAFREAKESHQREHVTPYIWENPELFKLKNLKAEGKMRHPEFRWTADTKEDLELVREIYKHLYNPGKIFYAKEIVDLLEKYPEIVKINENIQQKSL